MASAKLASSDVQPFSEPIACSGGRDSCGRKLRRLSSKATGARACDQRCTAGCQPPETPSASQATTSPLSSTMRSRRLRPSAFTTLLPARTSTPWARSHLARSAGASPRQSTHELDRRAGGHQVEGGEVGGIVVGREHDLPADGDAVAVGVLAHGAGEQDARQVVLREHERLLDRAGREQRLLRVHAPVALAHGGRLAAEVEALQEARHAVVVEPEAGGRGEQLHAARRGELAEQAREPDGDRRLVDERVGREQAAAAFEVLLGEDHGEAGARGDLRGEEARTARRRR